MAGSERDVPGGGGMPLAALQDLFYDLVTSPAGVAPGLAARGLGAGGLEALVVGDDRLSATARLDIYASMYFYRILDVLRGEYPRVRAALGDGPFHDLVTDYLLAARPAHPSLREAGARLAGYLAAGHPTARERPWLPHLARLERTHRELFDGPDAEPLTMATLQGLTPEDFMALEVRLVPCHAVLEHMHALGPVWPTLAAGELVPPMTGAETLLVWRQGTGVRHRVVDDPAERAMLGCAAPGATFGRLCDQAVACLTMPAASPGLGEQAPPSPVGAGEGEAAELAGRAFQILARWVDDGLVTRAGPSLASRAVP